MRFTLPRWSDARFEVPANPELLAQLTQDMERRGGALKPAPGWMLPENLVQGSLEDMLDPICGAAGQVALARLLDSGAAKSSFEAYSEKILLPYFERYVRAIDHAGMLKDVTLRDLADANWRVFDLESLMDFLQLGAFFDLSDPRQTILEIGGGFGRLIEFISLSTASTFRYINVDAVPVSMMYCHQYLTARFPHKRVRIFNPDTDSGTGDCDFLIIPAWHLEAARLDAVDLAINIESMQEMKQDLVDFYIRFIDRTVREDGLIFLINSREHEFVGNWEFPDSWQCLLRNRTARSWSIDHPTEIFRKTTQSQTPQNMLRAEAFRQECCYAEFVKELQTSNKQRYTPHGIPKQFEA